MSWWASLSRLGLFFILISGSEMLREIPRGGFLSHPRCLRRDILSSSFYPAETSRREPHVDTITAPTGLNTSTDLDPAATDETDRVETKPRPGDWIWTKVAGDQPHFSFLLRRWDWWAGLRCYRLKRRENKGGKPSNDKDPPQKSRLYFLLLGRTE